MTTHEAPEVSGVPLGGPFGGGRIEAVLATRPGATLYTGSFGEKPAVACVCTSPKASTRADFAADAARLLAHGLVREVIDDGTRLGVWGDAPVGTPLAELLGRGRSSLADVESIGTSLLEAAAAVHAAGVLLAGLDPRDVLVVAGRVGLRGLPAPRPVPGVTVIPPELAGGERPDPRSDVHAIGVVLYRLAVGEHPFPGDPDTARSLAGSGRFRRPRDRRPDLSEALDRAIASALEPDRDHRPPDVATLLQLWRGESADWERPTGMLMLRETPPPARGGTAPPAPVREDGPDAPLDTPSPLEREIRASASSPPPVDRGPHSLLDTPAGADRGAAGPTHADPAPSLVDTPVPARNAADTPAAISLPPIAPTPSNRGTSIDSAPVAPPIATPAPPTATPSAPPVAPAPVPLGQQPTEIAAAPPPSPAPAVAFAATPAPAPAPQQAAGGGGRVLIAAALLLVGGLGIGIGLAGGAWLFSTGAAAPEAVPVIVVQSPTPVTLPTAPTVGGAAAEVATAVAGDTPAGSLPPTAAPGTVAAAAPGAGAEPAAEPVAGIPGAEVPPTEVSATAVPGAEVPAEVPAELPAAEPAGDAVAAVAEPEPAAEEPPAPSPAAPAPVAAAAPVAPAAPSGPPAVHRSAVTFKLSPRAVYPEGQRDAGEVTCLATVVISARGLPESVTVSRCPDAFAENTRAAMMKARFEPPMVDGRNIAVTTTLPVKFSR